MGKLFGGQKPPKPYAPPPPVKPAAGEPAYQARDQRRRAAGATGYASTKVVKPFRPVLTAPGGRKDELG